MRGVNKVIIVGSLGKDPEVRYMPSGSAMAKLVVATSESWQDKTTGEKKEETEWHTCVASGRLAEIAGEYLRKGSKVYLEGSLKTRKWQDKQSGQDRYATEIRVLSLQMLDTKRDDGSSQPQQGYGQPQQGYPSQQPQQGYQTPHYSQTPQQQPARPAPMPAPQPLDFDDDIPF